jgi:putative ABC transport system substrate-binding protein
VLGAKRLELLRRLAPKATTIAVLVNPSPDAEGERRDVQAAAQEIGQQLIILDVNSDRDIETAFATFVERGAVSNSAFMISNRERASSCAAGQLCCARDRRGRWANELGTSLTDALRQVGVYTGRILGAKNRPICPCKIGPNTRRWRRTRRLNTTGMM